MKRGRSYLRLPLVYAAYLDGMRWSSSDNILEHNGGTFLFAPEIADFLEGFASRRPVLHFPLMVHLLTLLIRGPNRDADRQRWRLWDSYLGSDRNLRNAGAFCADVCRSLPDALSRGELNEVCGRLRAAEQIVHWSMTSSGENVDTPIETPPLEPEAFETFVFLALQRYGDEEMDDWLCDGRGPVAEAAHALAQVIPMSLSERLDTLLARPRLAAAQAFLKQLTGALTLPPRRLLHNDLPLGGYTDVTTHGNVDQILLSQFALDDWDFLRRFAERELLYFRREEPHTQSRQDMLVLLDQGVRTWGDIRIVLGAALLALGKQAQERKTPFLVATTRSPEIVDPLAIDLEALGDLVEASDLSPHPGLALERILEQPSQAGRDIVLLTHPRNLREDDVRTAAKRLRPGARLFALTLDRHGEAALCEMRAGIPILVREFRVDFSTVPQPTPTPAVTYAANASSWTGDVEPIPFPFQFGVNGVQGSNSFDFDPTSKLLLTAGPQGMLYLWNADGSLAEILPRGLVDGQINKNVVAVLTVADGFVVVGAFPGKYTAMHYHLDRRVCIAHGFGDATASRWSWQYSWTHHCLIAVCLEDQIGHVIDLGSDEKYSTNLGGPRNRAQLAWDDWQANKVPPQRPLEWPENGRLRMAPHINFDHAKASIQVRYINPPWNEMTPVANGRPLLARAVLHDAQLRGNVLVAQFRHRAGLMLYTFRGPDGTLLGETVMNEDHPGFALSHDGQYLARQVTKSILEIRHVAGSITPLGRTKVGGFSQQLKFELFDYHLALYSGKQYTLLKWNDGMLSCSRDMKGEWSGVDTRDDLPAFLKYDTQRWTGAAQRRLIAAVDCYGQVALFDSNAKLLCMFFAFRNHLAGWMPDGTRFGQGAGPPKPEIMQKFGKTLWLASVKG